MSGSTVVPDCQFIKVHMVVRHSSVPADSHFANVGEPVAIGSQNAGSAAAACHGVRPFSFVLVLVS